MMQNKAVANKKLSRNWYTETGRRPLQNNLLTCCVFCSVRAPVIRPSQNSPLCGSDISSGAETSPNLTTKALQWSERFVLQWYGYCCFASSFSQPQVYAGKFEKTYFPLSSLLRTLKQKSISCQSIKRHTHFCVILMRKVLIYKISCVHWRGGRLFPSAV